MPLKLKLFLRKYKLQLGYVLAFFFFLLYLWKGWDILYVEREEEVIPRPITYINSPDLFTESNPFVLKEGKEWLQEVYYTIGEGDREYLKNEIIESSEKQTEIKGTLKYTDVKVDIQNMISNYLNDLTNKRYSELNNYYTSFSTSNLKTSEDNWNTIRKPKSNFIIEELTPLYNVNSSRAIVRITAKGNYYDSIKETNQSILEIYALYDWDLGEFKILNPEYIPVTLRTEASLQLIEKTRSSPTHNLELDLKRMLVNFPNRFLFELDVRSSDNVIFNRIKIELREKETGDVIYEEKQDYKDFNPDVQWGTTIFQKRIGYSTSFWLTLDFKDSEFWTIYDQLLLSDNLHLTPYELVLTPINDSFTTIDYPEYTFDL